MNRIDTTFARLREVGRKAFMPYLTAGHPSVEATVQLILTLERAGADILELGMPFSDPIADGPTIQRSSEWALRQGITCDKILELVADVRQTSELPIALMSYYNPIFHHGLEVFCRQAAQAGADGLIVPDLPIEEALPLGEAAAAVELDLSPLVAPTTPPRRMKPIAEHGRGFLYCVSVTGVTGARDELPPSLQPMLETLRQLTDLPLVVGFGVSNPEQACRVAQLADGVIVGSAIVDRIHEHREDPGRMLDVVYEFASQLATATHAGCVRLLSTTFQGGDVET